MMSVTVEVSEIVAKQLESLSGDNDHTLDQKIGELLAAEYRRRIARYNLTDRQLTSKYRMGYDEFERLAIVKQRGYTWEVESDAMAWETAVDGIETTTEQLRALLHGRD